MSDPNLQYQSQAVARDTRMGWPGYVAWIVIFVVAIFLILANEYPELRGRKPMPKTSPLQMNLMGKYLVGMSQLKKEYGPQMLAQTEEKAESTADRIDTAILAGEVLGKDAAIKRLDAIGSATTEESADDSQAADKIAPATQTAAAFPQAPASQPTTAAAASPTQQQRESLYQLYRGGVESLSPSQRDALQARGDFFGRLALNFGKPNSDPQRAAILHEALFTAIVFVVFLLLVGLLGIAGFVLLILAIVFYFTDTFKTNYRPQHNLPPVFVEMFAAYLLLFVLGSLLVTELGGASLGLNATWLLTPIVPLAMGWGVIRGLTWREVLSGLGWFRGRGFWIEVPLGIVGYIAGLPIVALGLATSLFIARFTHAAPSHPIQNSLMTASAWQLYGVAAVWAPIVEETFFRGALFNHLRRRWGWWISAPIVAVIFAAIHPQGLSFIPALGSIAIVLAGIREWRGTIVSSIVAHGLNNATVVTLMLLTM